MVASEEMEYCLGVLQCIAKSSVVTEAMCFKFIPDGPKDDGSPKLCNDKVPNREVTPEVRTQGEKRGEDCESISRDIKNIISELIANEKSTQCEKLRSSASGPAPKQDMVPKPTAEEGLEPSKIDDDLKTGDKVKFEDLRDKDKTAQGSENGRDNAKCLVPYLLHSPDGQRYNVTGDCVIGRNSSCDLELKYASVSRKHALIRVEGNTYLIKALSGTQGLYVNKRKIEGEEKVTIQNGDKISMGKENFEFVCNQNQTCEKKVFF